MKTSFLNLLIISSLAISNPSIAAEDIVISGHPSHIRTLAASCSACHGTQGNAVGDNQPAETHSLAGESREHIMQRLIEFRSDKRTSTVMHHHAKGLTIDEINQLADYFSHQVAVKAYPPQSQVLKEME